MSEIRVTSVVGENGGDRVGLTTGLTVGPLTGTTGIGATISHHGHAQFAGVCTATSFSGSGANLTGLSSGLAMADQWRLTTSTGNVPANSDTYITDNWSRVNSDGFGQLGTGMTQSTGIFTFPSTGIYLVHWHIETYASSNAMPRGMNRIYTTTDNSSYGFAANSNISLYTSGAYGSSDTFFQFDVTNTSTHKVRFLVYYQASGVQLVGDSGANKTSATFLRLGDT